MNAKPTRDQMFAHCLRAALAVLGRSTGPIAPVHVNRPDRLNAIHSIAQVAEELEQIAAAEGPTWRDLGPEGPELKCPECSEVGATCKCPHMVKCDQCARILVVSDESEADMVSSSYGLFCSERCAALGRLTVSARSNEGAKSEDLAPTDADRLDWLEDTRRGLYAGTMDDQDGNPTRKLWVVDGADVSCLMGSTREAIDRARETLGDVAVAQENELEPTDGELLAWVMENTDAGERAGALHTVRWYDLTTGDEREMSAPSYREAILAAMQVSAADEDAPDPAEQSTGVE